MFALDSFDFCSKINASYFITSIHNMSAVYISSVAVDVEPSHLCSITFCYCATGGNRGAVWQMTSAVEVWMEQMCDIE